MSVAQVTEAVKSRLPKVIAYVRAHQVSVAFVVGVATGAAVVLKF